MKELYDYVIGDRFANSHGVEEGYLGGGILYYALTYIARADLAVCIGSGSGFVPKFMRLAQRDVGHSAARTILIDADIQGGPWGAPDYHGEILTKFRADFPDVEVIRNLSANVAQKFEDESIDYLHVDGDHSYEGVMEDFFNYRRKVKRSGFMTFHDSRCEKTGVPKFLRELREMNSYEVFDFTFGNGTTLVRKK